VIENGGYVFNYLESYFFILQQSVFWKSIYNSFIVSIIFIFIKIPIVIFLGEWILAKKDVSFIILRLIYIPTIIGGFVYAILFRYLNDAIGFLSNDGIIQRMSQSPLYNQVLVAFVLLWTSLGVSIIMYLNRRKHLSEDLIQFSHIEGATLFQRYRFVIFPYVRGTLGIITLLSIIEVFSEVEVPMNLTFGGPFQSTTTFGFFIFQNGILFGNYGQASAATILFFFMLFVTISIIKNIYATYKKNI
jgi:ABC-type sugar transport system permease subunit